MNFLVAYVRTRSFLPLLISLGSAVVLLSGCGVKLPPIAANSQSLQDSDRDPSLRPFPTPTPTPTPSPSPKNKINSREDSDT